MYFVLQFGALCVVAGELNSDPDVWQALSLTNCIKVVNVALSTRGIHLFLWFNF